MAAQVFSAREYDLSGFRPYELHILDLCHHIRQAGNVPLIIDAGANIGASTLWFAVNFPDCEVFAVEPDLDNFAALRKNSAGCSNIRLFNAALWDKQTALSPVYDGGTGWGYRVEEKRDGKTIILSVTTPELLGLDKRFQPVIIKIDIEGPKLKCFEATMTGWTTFLC